MLLGFTMRGDGRLNVLLLEATILEEAHLTGLFFEFARQFRAEFFDPDFSGQREPVFLHFAERIVDDLRTDTSLFEFLTYAYRALSLVDSRLHKTIGEALVALQAIIMKNADHSCHHSGIETGCRKFVDEFLMPVFAPGEIVHRLLAGLFRIVETIDLFRLEEVGVQLIDRLRITHEVSGKLDCLGLLGNCLVRLIGFGLSIFGRFRSVCGRHQRRANPGLNISSDFRIAL